MNISILKIKSLLKTRALYLLQAVVLSLFMLSLNAGTPHTVGGTVTYSGGGSPSSATFIAYITSRSGEVLTESSTGCGYGGGSYWIQCGNFSTSWTAGDVLHIDLSDGTGGSTSDEIVLTSNPADQLNLVIYSPDISISPTSWNYGSIEVGDNSTQGFSVTNTGGGTLSVTSTSLTGTDAGEFSITSGGGSFSLAPGANRTVNVQFSPSSAGVKSASLSIASNDPDENPLNVSLNGTGVTIPDISASPNPANYGSVLVWSYSDNTIVISNNGTGDLVVSSTTVTGTHSGEFNIQSGGGSFTLAPGTTRNIVVRFSPTSTGSKNASLQISNNDPNENPYNITLNGSGAQPDINVSPGSMNYEDVEITSSSTETFIVSNTGGATLSVSSSSITGTDAGDFSITGGGGSFTLSPGATRNVYVRFSPSSTGAKSAILRFDNDDPDEDPKDISLSGNGIVIPDISASPNPVNYGSIEAGSYSDNTVTVSNDGTGTLNVSSTAITGTHSAEFSIHSGGGSFSLSPGATRNIIVRFSPSSAGTKNASLRISSDDPDEDPYYVNLNGTGILPDINVDPGSMNFGDVEVGDNSTETFVVSNNGGASLSVSSTTLVGGNSDEFNITGGGGSFTLSPGATRNVDVQFSPSSEGSKSTTLRFISNDPDENPEDILLSGTGTVIPDISVSPDIKNYGDVLIGFGSAQIFTVTNEGTGNLSVSSSSITGTHSDEFSITGGSGSFMLTPGSSHGIEVNFNPGSEGTKDAVLNIQSNDPDEDPFTVSLTGSGVEVPVPNIDVDPESHNYGDVNIDTTITETFAVTNYGIAELSVTLVSLTGNNSDEFSITGGGGSFTLAPQATRHINVSFSPTSAGSKSAELHFESNDPDENPYDVELNGNGIVIPDIAISPESKDYGDVLTGSGSIQIFTVTNEGTGNLSVTSSSITGTHSDEFSITSGGGSFILTPGSDHDIEVNFNPSSAGTKNGILSLTSNDPDENPLDISLTGNGVDAPFPDISIEPQSYNYGDVPVDSSVVETFIISNEGTADLSVVSITIEGEHPGNFNIISSETDFILTPGSTENVEIRFIPDAHGIRNALLIITSDDPDENILNVPLTGTGFIIDIESPYLVNCYPPAGALSIPVNSGIQFRIKDDIDGVDLSTVDVYINEDIIISDGIDQTGGDVNIKSHGQDYTISYNPGIDLPEETLITVHVQCNDLSQFVNSLDSTYSFHTADWSMLNLMTDTIGPVGGIVYDDFTGIRIDIPGDALEDSTVITIGLINDLPELPDTVIGIGLAYHFSPDGLIFNDSLIIGIPYSPSDLIIAVVTSPMDIPVYYYSVSAGSWMQLEIFDYDDNYIYTKVIEFCYLTLCRINVITGINEIIIEPQLNREYVLYQNYPNPFADRTMIRYQIPEYGFVQIEVYSVTGRKVRTLVNEYKESGVHEVIWNARDDSGKELQDGIYMYILKSRNNVIIRKALLLK